MNYPLSSTLKLTSLLCALLMLPVVHSVAQTTESKAVTRPRVYVTPHDIENARANVKRFDWARKTADGFTSAAKEWLGRDDKWIRETVPGPGACFGYGFSGCTECSGTLGYWDKAQASFDDPGHVRCSNGHRLPTAAHPDNGTGYKAPDGRTHYLVGSYNAWVVEMMEARGAFNLAYAYSLTGDDRYADKASVILDALANSYPSCTVGSWDYPEAGNTGRFNRPQYQVARVLVRYVDEYDQIAGSASLDKPSMRAGLTRRQNIEENLIRNGTKFCYDKTLTYKFINNGQADYMRGVIAGALCLDIPEYIKWCIDGPKGFRVMLENNIGRDGSYYETSSGYSSHARALYWHIAESLANFKNRDYPEGVPIFNDPKFRRLMQFHNLANSAWGVLVPYGDHGPMIKINKPEARPYDNIDYLCLEYLLARSEGSLRASVKQMLEWMANGDIGGFRESHSANRPWMLFHAKPEKASGSGDIADSLVRRAVGSDFMGQKGIVTLRGGAKENAQSVLMRYGPSLNHGHYDDLNINWFANGTEVTYDLGYALGSTHALNGWCKLTASHNLVLVDEQRQLGNGNTGGSLHLFGDFGGVKIAEVSSEASYSSIPVTQYRRTLVMVQQTDDASSPYLLDLFRVRGGSKHDYIFHSQTTTTEFQNLSFGAETSGSLAGNGIAWGNKLIMDGNIDGYPDKFYWNPPPGNGFGFLMNPKTAAATGAWSADWNLAAAGHVRLTMAEQPGTKVVSAWAPGLAPEPLFPAARYVLARREGTNLRSEFAGVMEAYRAAPAVKRVRRIAVDGPDAEIAPVAVEVEMNNGTRDIFYSAGDSVSRRAEGFEFAGSFVHMRMKDGKVQTVHSLGAESVRTQGVDRSWKSKRLQGSVISADAEHGIVETDLPASAAKDLADQVIVFSDPKWSRSTTYRIKSAEAATSGLRLALEENAVLGSGKVSSANVSESSGSVIMTEAPHEYTRPVTWTGQTLFFQGKQLRNARSGAATRIREVQYGTPMPVTVESAKEFRPGDQFYYDDLNAGCRCEILLPAT